MFPRLKERLGTAVLDRIDILVELSTLGEYGLADDCLPVAIGAEAPQVPPRPLAARTRDDCPFGGGATPRRCGPPARP